MFRRHGFDDLAEEVEALDLKCAKHRYSPLPESIDLVRGSPVTIDQALAVDPVKARRRSKARDGPNHLFTPADRGKGRVREHDAEQPEIKAGPDALEEHHLATTAEHSDANVVRYPGLRLQSEEIPRNSLAARPLA